MGIECSSCYLIGYSSQWYLISLFVVDLALILRHREDCSIGGQLSEVGDGQSGTTGSGGSLSG